MAKKLSKKEREKLQRKLHKDIESVFTAAGFLSLGSKDVHMTIVSQTGEFDSIFVFENLIVFSEDTIDANPNDHLRKKAEFFRHCGTNKSDTLNALSKNFPAFKNGSAKEYIEGDFILSCVYASRTEISATHKKPYKNDVAFLDQRALSYFASISKTIKKSVRYEVLKFLNIDSVKLGKPQSGSLEDKYTALVLPTKPSGFPKGHILISFLVDPDRLLKQSYVLRKDGWLDNDCVYQRILIKSKIVNMRDYLTKEGRVFVNNIIVTLPDEVEFYEADGKTRLSNPIPSSALKEPIKISIPRKPSNIGIIDGQHRVFAYHEGDDAYEKMIQKMRGMQHLLVTGIVYPRNLSQDNRAKFEAKLFLEINDKQTRTNGALRQVIGAIVNPFSEISIAKSVVNGLAKLDPMKDVLEQHFFDKGKLKTTSIVSYGMRHVVKLSGKDSFYSMWGNKDKKKLLKGKNKKLLSQYTEYCTKEMNVFLKEFKSNIPLNMWVTDKKISRVLTTTTITGLIHCMRRLIENKKTGDGLYYNKAFKKIGAIDFSPGKFTYKSSHWKDLGDKIYDTCFK